MKSCHTEVVSRRQCGTHYWDIKPWQFRPSVLQNQPLHWMPCVGRPPRLDVQFRTRHPEVSSLLGLPGCREHLESLAWISERIAYHNLLPAVTKLLPRSHAKIWP